MPTISPKVTPYYGGGQAVNPANVLQVSGAPSTALTQEKLGTLAVDNASGTVYALASLLGGIATWAILGGGTGAVATITGNTGGGLGPTGGNINIVGAGALSFAGLGSTITGTITPGTALVSQLQGNSGGALSPTAGLISIVGSGAVSVVGSGSTLTVSVTPGTAIVSTLSGDSGGPLSPTAGNISLVGAANQILFSGAGSTITATIMGIFVAPGSIRATTSLTATLGNITATNGNLVLTAAGNKMVRTSVATTTTAGANSIGSVTLVGGTATISTTAVTASSLIQIWRQSIGATGAAALGMLSVGTISAGVSFVINALQAADATALQASDVSVIGWEIIN